MSLDIYVMPLWRYKVGDFEAPVERMFGMPVKYVSGNGVRIRKALTGWLPRWRAKRQVASIRREVERVNGVPVQWQDDGDVVYSQSSFGIEPLRAFARWVDCREQFPLFELPPEGNFYKHPAMAAQIDQPSCPHLVEHNCFNGYYLPCDFDRLAHVEPYLIFNQWPSSRTVGSSVRLQDELRILEERLREAEKDQSEPTRPLEIARMAYDQMREVAELSCQHRLPIIFWG